MPAKFDRVNMKMIALDKEIEILGELDQKTLQPQEIQLGKTEFGDNTKAFEIAISSMKQNEIAFFEFEEVYYDDYSKDRKKGNTFYCAVELKSWLTIINLFDDEQANKIFLKRGHGLSRVDNSDEINCSMKFYDQELKCFWVYDSNGFKSFNEMKEAFFSMQSQSFKNFDNTLFLRIMKTLKIKDHVFIEIGELERNETDNAKEIEYESDYLNKESKTITAFDTRYDTDKDRFYLEILIRDIRYFENLFHDNSVVKYVERNGYTTAKIETMSKIYFDYSISVKGSEIYSSKLKSI